MPEFRPRPTLRAQQLRNNATIAERKLWRHLSRRQLGYKFSRQMPVGLYICDFMCREMQLIIEVDGGQHANSSSDEARTRFIEAEGFRVVRFWNNEVMENLEGVIHRIANELRSDPTPDPSRQREGKSREAGEVVEQ